MRRTRLNCSYEPKYTETERKRWDIKEFWDDPKRYLTGVNELPTYEARYRTILDTRYVNPSTRKCKPVAYISRSGMIEYVDESAKIPEAREVINEEAVNRFKNWLQAREKHSVEDNIYNITHATVHGGYAWTRNEALDIEWAINRALQDGADPQQVVDDYQIVMWLTGLAEKQGYEYPEGAGIDVARATALAHEAINGNKINSNRSFNSTRRINSSRLSAKTQRAIRHCINSARRRAKLNCGVTRYADNEAYQTYYFITDDNSFVASFDVEIHEDEIEFAGFMRGYSADGYVVNENSVFGNFASGIDIAQALADFVYDKTGVTVYETENVKEFNNQLLTINKIFTNSRKSRIEKYTELRRASLKSSRRLNSGKLFYDAATGEYEEYEYDHEQDAWYQLPDEMYIFKLDLGQLADLVHDGIVSKHEIHEWIDELSEDWGGMPAWSPAKLVDKFEIQDLTEDEYYTWKDNFSAELARFADAVTRR